MAQNHVPEKRKPEVRRVDPQYRVQLPADVRATLEIEKDDYVYFTIVGREVKLHKVKLD